MTSEHRSGRSRSHGVRWALLAVAVMAVLVVGYTGHQALAARRSLELVAGDLTTLAGQLTAGEPAAAHRTLTSAQRHADAARSSTAGPVWWAAARLPGVGPNVVAIRTVAAVSDDLAEQVLPDVVEASAVLSPRRLRPVGGRVDLAPITAAEPTVTRATARLSDQSRRVGRLSTDHLLPQVAGPLRQLQDRLARASTMSSRAALAVRLLPPMLGAHGTRTYLLFFQNNAEVRSTGGLPGAFATLTARRGRLSLGNQGNAGSVGRFARPPLPLSREEKALFGADLGVLPQDTNFTPDFPRTARLLQRMWDSTHATKVDGVLSTDPVALSYLLRGTGPVGLPDGRQLTAADAVPMLLNEVYATVPDAGRQDAFFAGVARRVFDAVSSGQGRPATVLASLVTAADERRLLLWSDRAEEQALLAPTRLGGALTTRASGAPDVGVFLNDGGGSKLEYYLDYHVDVRSRRCQAGRQYLTVALHTRSSVPADPRVLADSIAVNIVGIPRGTIRTTVFVYAPVGGYLTGATYDGQPRELTSMDHDGRVVVSQAVDLEPGGRHTLTYDMVSGAGQSGRTDLRVTPGVRSAGIGAVGPSAC